MFVRNILMGITPLFLFRSTASFLKKRTSAATVKIKRSAFSIITSSNFVSKGDREYKH